MKEHETIEMVKDAEGTFVSSGTTVKPKKEQKPKLSVHKRKKPSQKVINVIPIAQNPFDEILDGFDAGMDMLERAQDFLRRF